MFKGKSYLIVGASEGLGRALASDLAARGANVIAAARSVDRLQELAVTHAGVRALQMDVTDDASVTAAANSAASVDGIIYCAGTYDPMAAADWQAGRAEQISDVNYTGALRVLSRLVPEMSRRGEGHIVLIGSLAGFRGLPGAIGYGASKAALMHLAENLYMDLSPMGIRVQQINPGYIRTRLTNKNRFSMPFILSPEEAAARVVNAMQSRRFAVSFPWQMATFFRLGSWLPIGLYRRVFG